MSNKNNKNTVTNLPTKGEGKVENQAQAVLNNVTAINKATGTEKNENDVQIVSKIVEGTIKTAETTAQVLKAQHEAATEIAESDKDKAIEVAKIEAEAKVKIAELENEKAVKIADMEDDTKTQIAEWEHEAKMKLMGVNERIDLRKTELDARVRIVKSITDAVTWVAGVGAFAAVAIVNTGASKEIQLEKIRQGHID